MAIIDENRWHNIKAVAMAAKVKLCTIKCVIYYMLRLTLFQSFARIYWKFSQISYWGFEILVSDR